MVQGHSMVERMREVSTLGCTALQTLQFNVTKHLVSILTDSQNRNREGHSSRLRTSTTDHTDGPFSPVTTELHRLAVHWARGQSATCTLQATKRESAPIVDLEAPKAKEASSILPPERFFSYPLP